MTTVQLSTQPPQPAPVGSVQVAGVEPFSAVDWPGKLVATVFLQGCPWKCTYCHNPAMQDTRTPGVVPWEAVLQLLRRRRGMLDGVVFSGGEPTRQPGLAAAIEDARELGFAVGLHTAGAFPARLAALLPAVDWVGIDIKATWARYDAIAGKPNSGPRAWAALDAVVASGVDHEVRLTVDPTVHTRADVLEVVRDVVRRGARAPVLQQARPDGANPAYAQALAGRGICDVIGPDDLPDLDRR